MTPRLVLTCCCLSLVGACLYFAPDSFASRLRGEITDALRPIQHSVNITKEAIFSGLSSEGRSSGASSSEELARITEELDAERERNRGLQIRLAQLAEMRATEQELSSAVVRSKRLIVPSTVEAAVLGDIVAEQWRAGKLLDSDLSTEDALLLGRCVIGKVEHVGRWTSTVQLVTDSRFRGRAQLIRETESGFIFESQGILKGLGGPFCRLEGIPAEKSVRVNDAVYTAERDGIMPTPLYYGQVVEATLGPDDREWTVSVKPASLPTPLTRVQVLRTVINHERQEVR